MGLVLDGATQNADIALTSKLTPKPHTVAIWVRNDDATAPVASNEWPWSIYDDTLTNFEALGCSFRTDSVVRVQDYGATTFTSAEVVNTYVGNTWTLILCIFTSNASRRIVLNGDWANSGSNTDDVGTDIEWDDISLGANISSGQTAQAHWDGAIASFCIWDIAFTEAQSDTLWNSGTPRATNLTQPADVIQYNELYDSGVADTGDNATLTGAPSYITSDHPYTVSTVTITDVDTDEIWDDGDTGLVITGTGFV